MATPNKKSAEAFLAALLQQKNFEGIVDSVGYVKCHKDMAWVAPMSPSPSIPRGRALPSQKYTVYIERVDKDKLDDTPYFKKIFPDLTNEALAKAITSRSGTNKQVQIGYGLYYELLTSQQISVNINFTTGNVILRLPSSQDHNGTSYPKAVRSTGIYTEDKRERAELLSMIFNRVY